MTYTYISSNKGIKDLILFIEGEKANVIAVDTEFVRKATYWPKLCLIQLCIHEKIFIIDALERDIDLSPLKALFESEKILKIFHSGRQDMEILYNLWGSVPKNIIDTQILGMVTGFGDSASYEKLNDSLLKKKIDKSQQNTDWEVRPLTEKQLNYAATDVVDLETIYIKLLKKSGPKAEYTKDELSWLMDEATYKPNPEGAWEKVKIKLPQKPPFWGRLKSLAAVREEVAIQKNLPRGHVIKDDVLITLASNNHLTTDLIKKHNIKDTNFSERLCAAHAAAVPFEKTIAPRLKKNKETLLDMLKLLLKFVADSNKISPKLLANKDDLISFLTNPDSSTLQQGWKKEVFGVWAESIMEGKVSLRFDPESETLSLDRVEDPT